MFSITQLSFAQMNGLSSILLGLGMLLVTGLMMRRSAKRYKRGNRSDPVTEVRQQFIAAEKEGQSQLHKLELRLHDYSRDVEARIETRIAVLDELVNTADREISRLETLLSIAPVPEQFHKPENHQQETTNAAPILSMKTEPQQTARHFYASGFSIDEIAKLTTQPEETIRKWVQSDNKNSDAA